MKATMFGAVLAIALLSACEPYRAQVIINETPSAPPASAPAAAPVIIIQPAPVQAPPPAPDYTSLILMTILTMLVVVVAIAIVLTRHQPTATPYAQVAPYTPEPAPPPAQVTNHYHIYIGIMPNETRGDALARLVRSGMRFEDASAALNAPRAHVELPAPAQSPKGWGEQ